MAQLGHKRKLAGPIKKRLTDMLNMSKQGLENKTFDVTKLMEIEEKLTKYYNRYVGIRKEIRELSTTETELTRLIDESEEEANILLDYDDMQTELRLEIMTLAENKKANIGDSFSSNNSNNVKLEKLTINKFDGNLFKWPEFWDSFETAIHSNCNLKDVEKFNYLKTYLTDGAAQAIAGLALSNVNYAVAVDILKSRFGNTTLIINSLYNKLQMLLPSTAHTSRLRSTIDEIENVIRSLEALKEDPNQNCLIPIILSKFPSSILLKIEEVCNTDSITPTELRKILNNIVSSRERVEFMSKTMEKSYGENSRQNFDNKPRFESYKYSPSRQKPLSAEALIAHEIVCKFCKSNHYSDECSVLTTIEERKNKLKNCCHICLKPNHFMKTCKNTKPCFHCKAVKLHHSSLCPKKYKYSHSNVYLKTSNESKDKYENNQRVMASISERSGTNNKDLSHSQTSSMVYMQTALVEIINKSNKNLVARALLDSGSQRTYITQKLFKILKCEVIEREELQIFVFGSENPIEISSPRVAFEIKTKDGEIMELQANVVPKIVKSFKLSKKCKQILEKHKNLVLAEDSDIESDIDLLLGNGYFYDIIKKERIEIEPGLHLVDSKLGWILSGRGEDRDENTISFCTYVKNGDDMGFCKDRPIVKEEDLDFSKLWDLETIGIRESPSVVEDDIALARFAESIKFVNGRYMVSWPWRDYPPEIPDNYFLAFNRLKSLLKGLDGNLLKRYNEVIEDQVRKEVIEEVNEECTKGEVVHYLPHHAVLTPLKSSTKLRVVYDASAKSKKSEKSLNESLLRGRVLMEDLCALILRFRSNAIGLVGDIEKAFLQIGLHEGDRDITRFLWVRNIDNPLTKENLKVYRFTRVAFGLVSSPFLLNATIKFHLNEIGTPLAGMISENIYIDNILLGAADMESACETYRQTKGIFKLGNMNIREWSTNSKEVKDSIPIEDQAGDLKVSILGLCWNTENDTFSIKYTVNENKNLPMTKREILKFLSSLYDPLGLFSACLIKGRILLRTIWCEKYDWDMEIDPKLKKEWEEIFGNLIKLTKISIPRYYGHTCENFSLICFTDASKNAYAAVVYGRFETKEGEVRTVLLFSKTRLTPLKETTIPRLELLSVVIGIRIVKFVAASLKIENNRIDLFSDSQCVLRWIESKKPLPVFIERRIEEIKNNQTRNTYFGYVKSEENPADLATRGCSVENLKDIWWEGPVWLKKPLEEWPQWEASKGNEEMDSEIDVPSVGLANMEEGGEELRKETPFGIKLENFSNYKKLIRVTAYCLRFIKKLRTSENRNESYISFKELIESKILWEKYIQGINYADVLADIRVNRKNELQMKFGLWLDERGLLRCLGRIQNAQVKYETKFPVLLPGKDHYSKLLIQKVHMELMHAGVCHTLNEIRKEYWIPKGRQVVRNLLSKCVTCRRFEGNPIKLDNFPPLPDFRIMREVSFRKVGIDFFGPLYLKYNYPYQKCWVCLLTCLTTRAVHLEIVWNLTTTEFLLGFKRFIARRTVPDLILSDNARQFHLAKNILTSDNRTVETDLTNSDNRLNIEWVFTTPRAPWTGGVFERMVGTVKRAMRKAIGKKRLTLSQMYTVLAEVEATINSRPLTYVPSDQHEIEVITPAHFIGLRTDLKPEFLQSQPGPLADAWRRGQQILTLFWKKWTTEYLTMLREKTTRHSNKKATARRLEVGEVVLLEEDGPRLTWKLGRIVELVPTASDNYVRKARIQLPTGHQVLRSIGKLVPLEIRQQEETANTADDQHADQL